MKILIKFPTRQRPQKFFTVLNKYYEYANDLDNLSVLVTCDENDSTMNNDKVKEHFSQYSNLKVIFGYSNNKIHAVNRDAEHFPDYDILLLASDDMIPQVQGYDDIIRNNMETYFPDTDGVLWYNDGHQGNWLNTLSIMGKKYYERFNYIYYPEYKSFYCDNEFTDISKKLSKTQYFDLTIIEHEHPDWGGKTYDDLYSRNGNSKYWNDDKQLYHERASQNFNL